MKNIRTIFTIGYDAGWTHDTLFAEMDRLGAILIDIMFVPYKSLLWNHDSLRSILGNRFEYIKELGHIKYCDGPEQLADPLKGLFLLEYALEKYPAIILACRCVSPLLCHRTTVAELCTHHINRWKINAQHLSPPLPGSITGSEQTSFATRKLRTIHALSGGSLTIVEICKRTSQTPYHSRQVLEMLRNNGNVILHGNQWSLTNNVEDTYVE